MTAPFGATVPAGNGPGAVTPDGGFAKEVQLLPVDSVIAAEDEQLGVVVGILIDAQPLDRAGA